MRRVSTGTYNDTQWHDVTLSRDSTGKYKLSADNQLVDAASGMCIEPAVLQPPFFYGGLQYETNEIKDNLDVSLYFVYRIISKQRR